ncbi:MAG TPA: hypothetical protein VFW31_09855 [Candidatus Angelobacter sp.]|nr:hypothetical protein [Candidatus Angelobacter sp.]
MSIVPMVAGLLALTIGCGGGGSTPSGLFFKVHTTVTVNGIVNDDPNVNVGGFVPLTGIELANACSQNPGGLTGFGPNTTDGTGHFTVSDSNSGVAIGPSCEWLFSRGTSNQCPVQSVNEQHNVTFSGMEVALACGVTVNTFAASPATIDPTAPPATMTITGHNMSATYAMPKIDFYDQNRTLWLEVTALSVSSDGTSLVLPANQITFADGEYAAVVSVMQADGTWNSVGGADIHVATPVSPPSGGGGGCTGRNCLPQC